MTPTSFAAPVAPRTGKINKNVFLQEEQICCKMVYYTLYLGLANRKKSCCKGVM